MFSDEISSKIHGRYTNSLKKFSFSKFPLIRTDFMLSKGFVCQKHDFKKHGYRDGCFNLPDDFECPVCFKNIDELIEKAKKEQKNSLCTIYQKCLHIVCNSCYYKIKKNVQFVDS